MRTVPTLFSPANVLPVKPPPMALAAAVQPTKSFTGGIIKPRWICFSWSAWIWALVVISRLSSTRETVLEKFGALLEARCRLQIQKIQLTIVQFLPRAACLAFSIASSAEEVDAIPQRTLFLHLLTEYDAWCDGTKHPNSALSWQICWLSGCWVMWRRSAARPKCNSSATITK